MRNLRIITAQPTADIGDEVWAWLLIDEVYKLKRCVVVSIEVLVCATSQTLTYCVKDIEGDKIFADSNYSWFAENKAEHVFFTKEEALDNHPDVIDARGVTIKEDPSKV